ncbi:MAG: SH3 domain-containing protein, partial [Odoribacter sp.]|nr:SH3 domain-containing protein [Odoribacter sp.]
PRDTVKGAPDNSGTSLFLIHEGLKVQVIEELGNWYNIRLADGNEGWVAKTDVEKI